MENLNTWLLAIVGLVVASLQAFGAWLAYSTNQRSKQNTAIIVELEKNTNSIKDALVKVTKEEAFARGQESGRVAGEAKAATLAEGRLQGKEGA